MKTTLVIVDDWLEVGRGIRRLLKRDFDSIIVATSPTDAENRMEESPTPPTHLICDWDLGEGVERGDLLVPKWRLMFPSIERAVLVSGSELQALTLPEGVDGILIKPIEIRRLRSILQITENAVSASGVVSLSDSDPLFVNRRQA